MSAVLFLCISVCTTLIYTHYAFPSISAVSCSELCFAISQQKNILLNKTEGTMMWNTASASSKLTLWSSTDSNSDIIWRVHWSLSSSLIWWRRVIMSDSFEQTDFNKLILLLFVFNVNIVGHVYHIWGKKTKQEQSLFTSTSYCLSLWRTSFPFFQTSLFLSV